MPLDLQRIEAICFDVDGTLSDTDDLWTQKLAALLHPLRFAVPGGDVANLARQIVMGLETPGNTLYEFLDHLSLDDDIFRLMGAIRQRRKAGLRQAEKTFLIIPQVADLLPRLTPHFRLSVVSAGGQEGTLAFLEHFGLRTFFHAVATSQTCALTKPHPDPVLWAAAQMGVAPERCLMVGDTTVDICAGKQAGAQTVGVLCGFGKEDELCRAGADVILPTTADLADLLLAK